jgi:hypothetical protein
MMIPDDVECLIYPKLSHDDKLVIGVRSIKLNANCAVSIKMDSAQFVNILRIIDKSERDMVMAKHNDTLIKNTKCNPCLIKNDKCIICGEFYR